MKYIDKFTRKLVSIDWIWFLLIPLKKLGFFLHHRRREIEEERAWKHIDFAQLFHEKKVLNGPFKGMEYPSLQSAGSMIYPKLIGSYEKELSEVMEVICSKSYSEIIDIGCAEGYYAIGLSLRIPNAKVFAYDTDEKARNLCLRMAGLNKVDDRVVVRSLCTAETLADFPFTDQALIICDCEGYELKLFSKINVKNLAKCDLLIETHDLVDINISTYLIELFSPTHEITAISSLDDIMKAKNYHFKEVEGMNLLTKKKLFSEIRLATMEWLFLTPKKNTGYSVKSNDE